MFQTIRIPLAILLPPRVYFKRLNDDNAFISLTCSLRRLIIAIDYHPVSIIMIIFIEKKRKLLIEYFGRFVGRQIR